MRVLNQLETVRLLAAVDVRDPFGPRDHALVKFMLHTGLRVSEVVALNVFHVQQQGQPRQLLHLTSAMVAKGGRERTIPLNDDARQAVREVVAFNARRGFSIAPDAPLLVTRKHERVSVRLVQRLVETLRKRAGLDVPATPHTLRHTFTTNVVNATGNVRAAQALIGHRSLNTVEIYAHVNPDNLARAVAAIESTAVQS